MIKLRIFLACADERLRIAILLFLDLQPGLVVVGITDRLPDLVPQLEVSQPDIVLLQWDMPFQVMIGLMADIHHLERLPKVISLSSRPEEKERFLAAGADYFVVMNTPPDELLPILSTLISANQCKQKV